jgi:hypothetical protein
MRLRLAHLLHLAAPKWIGSNLVLHPIVGVTPRPFRLVLWPVADLPVNLRQDNVDVPLTFGSVLQRPSLP